MTLGLYPLSNAAVRCMQGYGRVLTYFIITAILSHNESKGNGKSYIEWHKVGKRVEQYMYCTDVVTYLHGVCKWNGEDGHCDVGHRQVDEKSPQIPRRPEQKN